jgi:hypothetical protein
MPYDGRKYPLADARCASMVRVCVSGLLDEVAKSDAACRSEIDNAESSGMRQRVGAADPVELIDDRSDVKLGRMGQNRAPPRDLFVRRALAEQHQRRPATGPSETTDAQGFTSGSSIRESISPPRSERHGPPSRDTTPSAPSPGRSPEWREADRMNRSSGSHYVDFAPLRTHSPRDCQYLTTNCLMACFPDASPNLAVPSGKQCNRF